MTGNGGGIQQNTTVTLTVTAGAELHHFSLTVIADVQQGNQGTSTITTAISGGFNSAISVVGFGHAIGNDGEFQSQPDTGARFGQLDDDHHGRRQHTGRNLPDHRDGQRRRHPAEHDGYVDSDCIVGMGHRI